MSVRRASRSRSAVFAPLGEVGRAVRVEQRLADAIRVGLLADGERLPSEQELATMLGVATVTAREALQALRDKGLVTTVRGRGGGSFVQRPHKLDEQVLAQRLAGMSRVELRDRGTLYRVILAGCAELAAEFADEQDVQELRELVAPPDREDVAAWRHLGIEFTLAVAALTQSARMTREMMRQEAEFGVLLRLSARTPQQAGEHHANLVDALAKHDGDAARRIVQTQVDAALTGLAELHRTVR
ncbi:GntR family transcriptional regulator [Kineosporia sp. NBRC 101677]|uniref:FadR/GntR family transcriptional regulator n=1 Tax=Kineosporia sp. NBRC 101677 TaxID=3032197 RepID=UPI002552AF6D|nr:GntR family transcriptional regulator [Kineosporia sp. NBRC 101677]